MTKEQTKNLWQGFAICLTASTFCMFQYIVQVLPSILSEEWMLDFNISAAGISMLSSIFFMFYVAWQIPAGKLISRFGPRNILTLTMGLCSVGTVAMFIYPHYTMALVARALLGTATAFCIAGTYLLISHWFPLRWFALLAGMVQLMCCLGAMFTQNFIGYWLYYVGWRSIHAYLGLICLALTFIYYMVLRDKPNQASLKTTHLKNQPTQTKLFNNRLLLLTVYTIMIWVPVTTLASTWGVPFLCNAYGLEKTLAAKAMSWIWIGIALGSPLMGILAGNLKDKTNLFIVCSVISTVSSALFITMRLPWFVNQCLLLFIGFGSCALPVCFAHIHDFTSKQKVGVTIGFLNMAPCLSGALFLPVLAYLLQWQWDGTYFNSLPYHSTQAYTNVMLVIPSCGLISFVLGLVLHRLHKQSIGLANSFESKPRTL